ncbi:hypothetical protein BGZ60DRAFT_535454 [Tricladium varicosporioides]|nr:hypothetical protein BGZ60DRAFT_535454 [Hymenoscyphus varicosporioides]
MARPKFWYKPRSPLARPEASTTQASSPPSFSTGSSPPSFNSSPPVSINSDVRSSLEILPKRPKAIFKKDHKDHDAEKQPQDWDGKGKRLRKKLDIDIAPRSKDVDPPPSYTSGNPQSKRRRRRYWIGVMIVCCLIFLLIIVIIPVVVTVEKSHKSNVANTTTTVTVGSTLTQVSSRTATTTVVSAVPTTPHPTSTTTVVLPSPTIGGFDALEFGDQTMWLFYTDQNRNIKQIQASADTYYTRTHWSPKYPEIITSGVKPGSSVQAIGTMNPLTGIRSDIHLFFIGQDNKIKEITTSASSTSSNTWAVGSLSALNIEVSNSMFLRACTPWPTNRDYGDTAADLYIYYSSSDGSVKGLAWWKAKPLEWITLKDTPQSSSYGSVECQNDFGSTENMWLVNENSQLEQWTHNSTGVSSRAKRELPTAVNWTKALVYRLSNIHPQSSILSITSTLETLGGRTHIFFQDTSNAIRRLDVNGLGANATVQLDEIVDQGTPGTRLTTTNSSSTYCGKGAGVTIYYQRNTSEIMYYTFTDYYVNGGMVKSTYYGTPISTSTKVETYGLPPRVDSTSYSSPPPHTGGYSIGQICGIVVGVIVGILILGTCCCA